MHVTHGETPTSAPCSASCPGTLAPVTRGFCHPPGNGVPRCQLTVGRVLQEGAHCAVPTTLRLRSHSHGRPNQLASPAPTRVCVFDLGPFQRYRIFRDRRGLRSHLGEGVSYLLAIFSKYTNSLLPVYITQIKRGACSSKS